MAVTEKGGRPRTHWADKARVTYWYLCVRKLTGWSDYRLDTEFAMPQKTGDKKNSAARPRVFEKIRKNCVVPSRGSHWRKPIDLVAFIAARDGLHETLAIYESEFWSLMKAPPSLTGTHKQLQRLMATLGLTRVDPFEHKARYEITKDMGRDSCFIFGLEQSLNGVGWLDRLTLLALLTREADLSGNTEVTKLTRSYLDEHLDLFFNSFFPDDVSGYYYQSAVMGYCFGERKVSPSEMGLRGRVEVESWNPIMRIA